MSFPSSPTVGQVYTAASGQQFIYGTDGIWSPKIPSSSTLYVSAETSTGKTWIDGKTIYRKVISYTDAAVAADVVLDAALTVSYIGALVSISGVHKNANGQWPVGPYGNNMAGVKVTAAGLILLLGSGTPTTNTGAIVVEYTKS